MKKYIHYLILTLTIFSSQACQEENITTTGGQFNITLQDAPADTYKRSLPTELSDELKRQFVINIEDESGKSNFKGTLEAYNAGSPALKPATYYLQATYGENKELAIDEPYYTSEKQAGTISANKTTDINLLCSVGNALASFAFADAEKASELLPTYSFVTKVGETSVSCTADDGHNPYFREGVSVDFYLQGTTTDNKQVDYKFASISSAKRQMNYKYTLTIGEATEGNALLGITVNTSIESITITETLPQEWLPKAKLTADGFDGSNTLNYRETTDAPDTKINYQAVKPVEEIEFTFNLEDQNLQSLNKTYLLSELTEEERQELAAAGVTLPELNSTAGSIDLTGMTNKLLCANDGSTAVNRIDVRIKANNRWSDTGTYTINALRPEFNIAVNENDFWSKEFAIRDFTVTEGNADRVKAQTVYQYSTDGGGSWTTFSEGMKQKFSTHPEIKNYTVRALYRNALASNIADVTLETPTQLPNSNMDEWTDENYFTKDKLFSDDEEFYCFYPWITKGNCHWDTNNSWTTRHRWNSSIVIYRYNGFPAVTYVAGRSGLAAELKSTATARGNMVGTIRTWNKVAGQLFTGTAEAVNKGSATDGKDDEFYIHKDAQFDARPTAVSFYYKYQPYDGNSDETWTATIELLDESNNTICMQSITQSGTTNDWQEKTITLPFADGQEYKKAKYIYVYFASTSKTGDEMLYKTQDYTYYYNQCNNTITAEAQIGSILTIDDISLIYDK